ncbi:MAG: translation elongation factor Ts [Treponema sp.]|jgi:elongation factor Ts|nr:translation elongation factor Ts [Treponema sp.]
MAISATEVKKLREKTGAGPMECKKALEETNGDFGAAEKLLKEKGLAAVEKRAERATNEGKIFVKIKDKKAVLVEIASETDFVARNPEFIELGGVIADKALEQDIDAPTGELDALVTDLATKIRENLALKRLKRVVAADNERLTQYIHGDGAIGIVVKLSADKSGAFESADAENFAYSLAMHIAAFTPVVIDQAELDPAFVTEQEEIFRKQIDADEGLKGKSERQKQGILKGKLNKYLKSICMLDQGYIKDEKITVAQALDNFGKQTGAKVCIAEYVYFKVGQE